MIYVAMCLYVVICLYVLSCGGVCVVMCLYSYKLLCGCVCVLFFFGCMCCYFAPSVSMGLHVLLFGVIPCLPLGSVSITLCCSNVHTFRI